MQNCRDAGISCSHTINHIQLWSSLLDKNVKRFTLLSFALLASLQTVTPVAAQTTIYGGRGLMRVASAEPIGRSQFFANTYFQTFLDPSKRRGSLGKDHTLTFGFTVGLSHSLELTLLATPYQDDQQHVWGPPGDTHIGLKLALPLKFGGVSTGMRAFAVLPTAKNANVSYEPFSSGKLGAGVQALMTIDMTQSFPLVPLKLYLNFGYMDHMLNDSFFTAEQDQFLYGVGIKFPIRSLVFHTEYTAEVFANNPNIAFAENSSRLSQGVKFLGPWDIILDLTAEVGLDKPAEITGTPQYYQKDYADWKVILGFNYQFTSRGSQEPVLTSGNKRSDERIKRELDEIRGQREGAQQSLQDMEKALDDKEANEKKEEPEKKDPPQE